MGCYKRQTEVPLIEWNALKAEIKKPINSTVLKSIIRKPVASTDDLVVKRKHVASTESQECDAGMKLAASKGAKKVAKSKSIELSSEHEKLLTECITSVFNIVQRPDTRIEQLESQQILELIESCAQRQRNSSRCYEHLHEDLVR